MCLPWLLADSLPSGQARDTIQSKKWEKLDDGIKILYKVRYDTNFWGGIPKSPLFVCNLVYNIFQEGLSHQHLITL